MDVVFNPIPFLPVFREEKLTDYSVTAKKLINNKTQNSKRIEAIELNFKEKLFYISKELFFVICSTILIYILYHYTRTDVLSFAIWLIGLVGSLFLALVKDKILLAKVLVSFTSLASLVSLVAFYKQVEIAYNHVGIYVLSYVLLMLSYLVRAKLKETRERKIWYKVENVRGRRFFLLENTDDNNNLEERLKEK